MEGQQISDCSSALAQKISKNHGTAQLLPLSILHKQRIFFPRRSRRLLGVHFGLDDIESGMCDIPIWVFPQWRLRDEKTEQYPLQAVAVAVALIGLTYRYLPMNKGGASISGALLVPGNIHLQPLT